MNKVFTLKTVCFFMCMVLVTAIDAQCEFTVSNANPCGGEEVEFIITSPGPVYSWDFDGDSNPELFGDTVNYAFPESNDNQIYPVTVFANNIGCNQETYLVMALPDPSIGIIPGSGIMNGNNIRLCSGDIEATLSVFNASSTYSTNLSYTINWGDGTIEVFDNLTFSNTGFISHMYNGFGFYDLTVSVVGQNGCTNSQDYIFYNGSNPSLGISNPGNTVGLCVPATITFPINNTSGNPAGTEYFIYIGGVLVESFTQDNVPASFTYTFTETSCGVTTSTGNYSNAFDVRIEAVNPCASTQATIEPIEVSEPPSAVFEVDEPFPCVDDVITVTNLTQGTEVLNGNCSTNLAPSWAISPGVFGVDWNIVSGNPWGSDILDIEFLLPGDYVITMTINSSACGGSSASDTITVVEPPVTAIETDVSTGSSGNAGNCIPASAIFTNNTIGVDVEWYWSISPSSGWEYADTSTNLSEHLEVIFNQAGTYDITLLAGNACETDQWDTTLVISDVPEIIFNPIPDFCEEATLNFGPSTVNFQPNGSSIENYSWHFPGAVPDTSNQQYPVDIFYENPGDYILSLEVTNACGTTTIADSFSILTPQVLTMSNDTTVCANEQGFYLTANPAGGQWSGFGITPDGWFAPSNWTVGENVLNYSLNNGACSVFGQTTVTVLDLPVVNAGNDQLICENNAPFFLGATPSGGTWTIDNGGVILSNSIFDPQSSGPGIYNLTYSFTGLNGCENTDSKVILVNAQPLVNAGPDVQLCDTPNDFQLSGQFPLGGFWTGFGVTPQGVFNPANTPGLGVYNLNYVFTDPFTLCSNDDDIQVTVFEAPDIEAGPNDSLCIDNGLYVLNGAFPGGAVWSGPGIIDAQNGIFDPQVAGGGWHVLNYTLNNGNCQVQDSRLIYVIDLTETALEEIEMCISEGPLDLNASSPSGGLWSGPGIVDAQNGIFDPQVAQAGIHTITYTYFNAAVGCNGFVFKEITVYAVETPEFESDDVACANETIQFYNSSTPGNSAFWDFGDGGTSIDFQPIHIFSTTGTYEVLLVMENDFGCKDSTTQTIYITEVPQPFFQLNTYEGCAPLEVDVTNQTTGYGVTFFWYFSNGISSMEVNPDPVLFDQGINDTTYQITLGVVNLCGASYYQDSVLVHPSPTADFGISPESNCTPVVISFANVSYGSPTSFFWNFGNGNTSTDSLPGPQTFTTDSTITTYTITLTASNQCGFDTAQQVVTVEPADVQSFFNVSTLEGCEPLTVDFFDYSTPGANVDWDFGDGNSSSLHNPSHTYTEPGEYTVIQYATNLCGFDSTSVVITVNPIPEVSFTHLPTVCMGQEIQFNNTSVNTSGHFWDFGDGDSSLLNNPVHIYQTSGFHTVTLTGYSNFNQCPASFTSEIYVLPAPTASFEPSTTNGCAPFSIDLVNNSLNAAFFEWDFGDGNFSVLENPAHTYHEEGTYTISLIVTDLQGCYNDTTVFNIQVHPKPTADFTFERAHLCGVPVDVQFFNHSQGADGYLWDFGDGNQSFLTEPVHTYTNSGHFLTILMVSTAFGCRDSLNLEVSVYPQPIADFEIETAEGCAPLQVFFNNESGGSDLYYWAFGDGGASLEANPVHVFNDPGFYDVQLIATSENVCFDTIFLNDVVEVLQTPFANFDFTETAEGIFQFTNLSEFADAYFWDFSDGTTSDLENPAHRFLTNGAKQIYLEASSLNGCVDDTLIAITPTILKALYVPSGFSPEQGIGEVRLFKPKGVGLKEYHMQIFSTYGQLIWESREIDKGQPVEAWDGTYKGQLLPQDVYVWKAYAIFEDGTSWRGNLDEAGNYKTMGSVILLR